MATITELTTSNSVRDCISNHILQASVQRQHQGELNRSRFPSSELETFLLLCAFFFLFRAPSGSHRPQTRSYCYWTPPTRIISSEYVHLIHFVDKCCNASQP